MHRVSTPAALLCLMACAAGRGAEDPSSWYEAGSPYEVEEAIEFTQTPYSFTGETELRDVPRPGDFETWFSDEGGLPEAGCQDWLTTNQLPVEITGIVTAYPRYYYKTTGCRPTDDREIDSDEKYYGSYFIQDASGGFFVLGDSKVAHFDFGDKVTLKVRAVKESFDIYMIASHDVVEIDRGPYPVYYEEVDGQLGADDNTLVRRMTGTVGFTGDFGEIQLCLGTVRDGDFVDVNADDDRADAVIQCIADGRGFYAILDSELDRRGVGFDVGEQVTLTGPVFYSFNEYRIVITRLGQVERL
jgi:hypothetical protein